MNRRHFVACALAAAPAAALAGSKDAPNLSSSVVEFGMAEMAEIILDYKHHGKVRGDHAARTARVLRLLDSHMGETGAREYLEVKIRSGEQPEVDIEMIARIWERYGLTPDRFALSRALRIPSQDWNRARAELGKSNIRIQHAKLVSELERLALDWESAGKVQPVRFLRVSDCWDCFCRFLRIEAAVLTVAGAFYPPAAIAAAELLAIEAVLEYGFQVCDPGDCSDGDLSGCRSILY